MRGAPKIVDEFTDRPVSRQRKWQLRKKTEGRCVICGNARLDSHYCELHMKSSRERDRIRKGCKNRLRSKYQPDGGKYHSILEAVGVAGEASPKALGSMLGIHGSGIYRYLNILESEGKIRKSYGKVVLA